MQAHQATTVEQDALQDAAAKIGAIALVVAESVGATGAQRRERTPKQAHSRLKARSEGSDLASSLAESLAVYAGASNDPTFQTLRRGQNGWPELLLLNRFTCSPRWKASTKLTTRQANQKYQVPDTYLDADLTLFDLPGQEGHAYRTEPIDLSATTHLTVRVHRDSAGTVREVSIDCFLGDASVWPAPIVADLAAILVALNSWRSEEPWLQYARSYGLLGSAAPTAAPGTAASRRPEVPPFKAKTRAQREANAETDFDEFGNAGPRTGS